MPDDQHEIPWDELREFRTPDGKVYMPQDAEGNFYDVELRVVYLIDPGDSWFSRPTPPPASP